MLDEKMMIRFEVALANNSLAELVRDMKAEGRIQLEIFECFEQFRALLRELAREAHEEQVMDTMDYIVGWCSPHAKLFTHYLTNEEIEAYGRSQEAVKAKVKPET
jgi:hypothetical protein